MTLQEVYQTLQSTGLPVAYLAFPALDAPQMPFLIYEEIGSDNFGADNIVWHSASRIQVDLFTKKKSRELEALVESTLTSAGIYWERETEFEDDEVCYRVIYTFEI